MGEKVKGGGGVCKQAMKICVKAHFSAPVREFQQPVREFQQPVREFREFRGTLGWGLEHFSWSEILESTGIFLLSSFLSY